MSFCFCKKKTAYEMRISDWSSDVCSSDLDVPAGGRADSGGTTVELPAGGVAAEVGVCTSPAGDVTARAEPGWVACCAIRSEEHTSELQSLMRISYAVFCLKKKTTTLHTPHILPHQLNRRQIHIEQSTC